MVREFTISSSGAFQGTDAVNHHMHDHKLANALVTFFNKKNVSSIVDLGAGMGHYTETFRNNSFFANCYDGNLDTQLISQGRCAVLDLSKPINLQKHDWALSLEVGEHLPQKFESIYIKNILTTALSGVVLSWAVPGQGGDGHYNERENDYIRAIIENLGFYSNYNAENFLRTRSIFSHFKNTIMVFEKSPVIEENYFPIQDLLIDAVLQNDIAELRQALLLNPNIDYLYNNDATALFLAVQNNNYEVAEILLKSGANPNLTASTGSTALHMAVGENNTKMVELLLNYGGSIERLNSKNVTPLYIASYLGYSEMVRILLKAGANMLFAINGKNCLRIAAENKHQETFALLSSNFIPKYGFVKEGIKDIAYYALVKDEQDIIFENLVWHFVLGFRKFVIMDNMSSDKTLDLVNKFKDLTKNHALVVTIQDPEVLHYHGEKATGSYYFMRSVWPEVKWVFPTDADEFWVSREPLDQVLSQVTENNYIKTYAYRYHPTDDFYNNEQSNFYQKLYLRDYSPHVMEKNIIQVRDDIAIGHGNHFIIEKEGFNKAIPYNKILSDNLGIYMYEYYLRSPKQTISKYIKVMNSFDEETIKINPVLNQFDSLIKAYGLDKAGEITFDQKVIDESYAINDPLPFDLAFNIFNEIIS